MMKNNDAICIRKFEGLGKGKYRITFDNAIVCQVYGTEIRSMKLEEGSSISEEQYHFILKEIVGKRAKKRALHLLEQMDRTEQQLRDKLAASDYPETCIEDAITYVKSFHYLDDTRYAETFTRYSKEKLSRGQIKQKLMAKGVKRETINQALECEYDIDEAELIRELLMKKHYNPQEVDDRESRLVYQYLLRRGFKSSDILREMRLYEVTVID